MFNPRQFKNDPSKASFGQENNVIFVDVPDGKEVSSVSVEEFGGVETVRVFLEDKVFTPTTLATVTVVR